jgi:HD-like signal output (HDOD) protein
MNAANTPGVLGAGATAISAILATLYQPDVGAQQVARVISQEPGMTARVLRVANSPLYGQSRTVSTVDRAVILLGLATVRGIAAAACMRDAILRATASGSIDAAALLRHSIATGLAARALCASGPANVAEDAFVAGLIHDLGITLLARLRPGDVEEIGAQLRRDPACDISALERERMGIGHALCAGIVFELWHLPESLTAAAYHHHDPEGAPAEHRTLAALVTVADELSRECRLGFVSESSPQAALTAATALLGSSRTDMDGVAAMLPGRLAELERVLA